MDDSDKQMEVEGSEDSDPYSKKRKFSYNKFVSKQFFSADGIRCRIQNANGVDRFILGSGWYILPYISAILYIIFITYQIFKT